MMYFFLVVSSPRPLRLRGEPSELVQEHIDNSQRADEQSDDAVNGEKRKVGF